MATASYLIPERNLTELEARIEKLNRRARKLGIAEIAVAKKIDHVKARCNVLTIDGHINSQCWELPENIAERNAKWPCQDTGERMAWWTVEVIGESPSLNGWQFVAVLEPMATEEGETLNLVQCLPGEKCPAEYRERIGVCDHCKAFRRRKQTFVVRHADGSCKCVGRQCIKDFLGYHADPHALAGWAEMLAELGGLCESACDEEWLGEGGGRGDKAWDLNHFLTLTACRIRLFGWLGRGKAFEQGNRREATADNVLELLTPPSRYASDKQKQEWEKFSAKHIQTEGDGVLAEAAVEWAKAIPATELESSDYLANVNLVARVGYASPKTAGIAASVIVVYQKAMEQEIKRQEQAAKPPSEWIGEKGKRIECLEIKCEKVLMSENSFGVTGIHKMADATGNDLTWFASGGRKLNDGEAYFVSASVKDHGEYRGRKQTILTRVSVLTAEQAEAVKAKQARKAAREAKKAAKSVQSV